MKYFFSYVPFVSFSQFGLYQLRFLKHFASDFRQMLYRKSIPFQEWHEILKSVIFATFICLKEK